MTMSSLEVTLHVHHICNGVCPWVRDVSKFPKFLRGVSLFVELGLRAHRRLNDLHGWRSVWTATYRALFIGNAKSVIPKPLCVLARVVSLRSSTSYWMFHYYLHD